MGITKLKKDFRGYFYFRVVRKYGKRIKRRYFTFRMKIILFIQKVKYNGKISFYGKTIFIRFPESIIRIGKNCVFASDDKFNLAGINRKCTISTHAEAAKIIIGDNVKLSGAVIGAKQSIIIGDNVLIGANSFISDFDWHNIHPGKREMQCEYSSPIEIGKNVWLGMNVSVLKGVKIGDNSVIGANSVVVSDIPENVIAVGNPCKVIKELQV